MRLPPDLAVYPAVTFFQCWLVLGSLVFPFVLWGVIGVVAAITAIGFPDPLRQGNLNLDIPCSR